jgi:hypothetical protein
MNTINGWTSSGLVTDEYPFYDARKIFSKCLTWSKTDSDLTLNDRQTLLDGVAEGPLADEAFLTGVTYDQTIDNLFGNIISTELTDLFNKPAAHGRAMWCTNSKPGILEHRARDLERRDTAARQKEAAAIKRAETAVRKAAAVEAARAVGANELSPSIDAEGMGSDAKGWCANDSNCIKRRVVVTTDDFWRLCPFCSKLYFPLKNCQTALLAKHIKVCKQKSEIERLTFSESGINSVPYQNKHCSSRRPPRPISFFYGT